MVIKQKYDIMKTLKFIPVLMLMVMITGCTGQAQNPAEILKDEQRREEIMVAISNDHDMMNEMMDHMMKSDLAMQMMEGHQGMMGKMIGNRQMMMNLMEKDTVMAKVMMDNMMGMMEKDSTMSNMMGGMMMGNKHMMGMMQQMGKSGGMMPHNRQ